MNDNEQNNLNNQSFSSAPSQENNSQDTLTQLSDENLENNKKVDESKLREISISKDAAPTSLEDAYVRNSTKKPNSTIIILVILAICIVAFWPRLSEFFSNLVQNNQTQIDNNNNDIDQIPNITNTPSDDIITPSDDINLYPETKSE